MTRITRTSTAGALSVLAALALAGCHSEPAPAPASTSALPAPSESSQAPSAGPSSASPGEEDTQAQHDLALKTAKVMTTWTPRKDLNRTAAELRARSLMTPERAKEVVAPQRPASGDDWHTGYAMDATSVPSVEVNEADDSGSVGGLTVSVIAHWSWKPKSGPAKKADQYRRYYFTFTDTAPYKIRDYTYEDSTAD